MNKRGARGPFHTSRAGGKPGDGGNPGGGTASFLLREDNTSRFLLENGTDKLLLEV